MHRLLIIGLLTGVAASVAAVELTADGVTAVAPDNVKPFTATGVERSVTWTTGTPPATLQVVITLHPGNGGLARQRALQVLAPAMQEGAKLADEKGMGQGFHLIEVHGTDGKPTVRAAAASYASAWLSVVLTSPPGFLLDKEQRSALDGLLSMITVQGVEAIPPTALRFLAP